MRGLILTAIFILMQQACFAADELGLSTESKLLSSGRHYLIIHSGTSKADFELTRPDPANKNVLLCIPAAFSSPYGDICGFYACRGSLGNTNLVDKKIGGAIEIKSGLCRIFDTKNGDDLSAAYGEKLKTEKSSFFQQFQVVKDGHAEGFKDKSHFQRRCIATFSDGSLHVIESDSDITFSEFGSDLVELGVQNAVYTDMGPWSGGWYRDAKSGKRIVIGNSRMMTKDQTNWFVLKKQL